jgi:hypothetical protein
MMITVQDFSGVYAEQPFMQGLREGAGKFSAGLNAEIRWMDCTGIPGTDCYCDDDAVTQVRKQIATAGIKSNRGIHFFDNGNYHYMSKIWTDMVQEPFSLVVFDHHPDMQEPRFGNILSCGGWVLEVLKSNPFVQGVTLIGVADHLADEIGSDDKVTFIRESELFQIPGRARNDGVANTVQASWRPTSRHLESVPLYISIDKDALAPAYAATNWDQGSFSTEMLKNTIAGLAASHKILGVDICGERARDFAGDENHNVQEADALNSELNRELTEFLLKIC